MICEFCGEEVSEGALACPRCGSPVSKPPVGEKPETPSPTTEPPPTPGGASAQLPHEPAPETPPSQIPQTDAGRLPPDARGATQQENIPPWEMQAPTPAPTQPQWQAQPEQAPYDEPPQVPLAKQEEDFIALAEEKARVEELGVTPADSAPDAQSTNGVLSPEAAIIEQGAAPGSEAGYQPMAVENDLTGGQKGAGFVGASVAGAGVQTAEDPFGLKVTETAPPIAADNEAGKQFNWAKWHNILMMIVTFLVAGAVAATGVYFGFLRKKTTSTADPVGTVSEYCTVVLSGDTSKLADVSTPGSLYQKDLSTVIEPYEKLGALSMKDFKATTIEVTDAKATVEIKKFVVKSLNSSGDTENLDLLSINSPSRLRTTVSLVKQNGKWLVSN